MSTVKDGWNDHANLCPCFWFSSKWVGNGLRYVGTWEDEEWDMERSRLELIIEYVEVYNLMTFFGLKLHLVSKTLGH